MIGSVEKGKLADLVLWSPAFFGVKPELVIKGGSIVAALDGRPQRLDSDAAAGALPADVRRFGRARTASSVVFVSKAAREAALAASSASRRSSWPCKDTA